MKLSCNSQSFNSFLDKRYPAIILFGVAIISFLRSPSLFINPRFWAEEGSIYFKDAILNSFFVNLLTPKQGYISLFNNVISGLAAVVPLRYSPFITTYSAFGIYLLIFILIILHDAKEFSSSKIKIAASIVMLFSFPSHEVWLNSGCSQFILPIGTALILISPLKNQKFFIISLLFSAVSAFTGPVSIFLSPFFILKAIKKRQARILTISVIYSLGAFVQFIVFLISRGPTRGAHDIIPFLTIVLFRLFLVPFLGPFISRDIAFTLRDSSASTFMLIIIGIAIILCCITYIVIKKRLLSALLLLISSLLIVVLSLYGSLTNSDPWHYMDVYLGGRYLYAPVVLLGIFIVLSIVAKDSNNKKVSYYISLSLLAIFIFWGIVDFFKPYDRFYRGPDWRVEVARWNIIGNCPLRIWPWGWEIDLPQSTRESHCKSKFILALGNEIKCDGDSCYTRISLSIPSDKGWDLQPPLKNMRYIELSIDSNHKYCIDFLNNTGSRVDHLIVKSPVSDSGLHVFIEPLRRFDNYEKWRTIQIRAIEGKGLQEFGHIAYW